MPHPDEDIFKTISDFIKGKTGSEGLAMAKLSWEGSEAPTLPAMPKMSGNFGEFAKEYSTIVSGLAGCTRLHTVALIGAMLTLPELQGNCYRLEVLAHLAAQFANGKNHPTAAKLCAWFNQLDQGTCGRQEDPAEDLFISHVYYGSSNYRLFEGTAEGNSFYTQIFLSLLDDMPNAGDYRELKRSIEAVLRLSNEIAERGRIPRNIVGYPSPRSEIQKPTDKVFGELSHRVVFSHQDLSSIGIEIESLRPFIIRDDDIAQLRHCAPGCSPLEFKPIVEINDKIAILLPTAIGVAIRGLVIEGCLARSIGKMLERSFANAYTSLFVNERLFGELRNPPIKMVDYGAFHASQMTVEIDHGRYLHLIFFVDGITDYEKGGFLGVNPIEPISKFIDKSFNAVSTEFSAKSGFREGLSLVVGCGWGRFLGLGVPQSKPGWRIEMLPGHDLLTLSHYPRFKLLDLFRVLDARDAVEGLGINFVNANGFLNLYGWMKENKGHIVPHEKLESDFISDQHGALLSIPQNSILKIRYDAAIAADIHVAVRPDGTNALVRRVNGTPRYGAKALSPFYADIEILEKRIFRSVFEGTRCKFWTEARVPEELGVETQFHLSNMVMNWSEVVFRQIETQNLDKDCATFSCVFKFLDKSFPKFEDIVPDEETISSMIDVSIDKSAASVSFEIGAGFVAASRRVDNAGERSIVHALLKACLACVSPVASEQLVDDIASKIIGDDGARHFHAFATPDLRDFVRDSLPDHGQVIEGMDDANSRIGLGWLKRDRAAGGEIEGRKECCTYLNELVRAVAERIRKNVAKFDRTKLIQRLLVNHEALFAQSTLWQRTFRAVRALSADSELATQDATDEIAHFNAASLASRIIAEIALCESPMNNGSNPGNYDIANLLADASQMFHLGGYSDAMNAEAMPAKIRISPAGDVLMDHGFTDQIVRPFGEKFQSIALDNAAERYSENYAVIEEDEPGPNEDESISGDNSAFDAAWQDEFGFSIDDTRKFVDVFHKFARERGEAVFLMPLPKLFTSLAENTGLQNATIQKFVSTFTLKHRPQWDKAPVGFTDSAWLPWRFRRQLSVISRPIIQLEDKAEAQCVLAPAMIVHHIAKFVSDVHLGRFDEKIFRQGGMLSKWIGEINRQQGEAFNQKVADKFVALGWKARANLSDGQILNRESDQKFGDVDVLAWSEELGRVLVIECKDLSFDKTLGEIARRLARYRGTIGSNGEKDDLRKHLDRCEIMRNGKTALSNFVGFVVHNVESVLIFNQPTPLQFHEAVHQYAVEMLTFKDIADWIIRPKS